MQPTNLGNERAGSVPAEIPSRQESIPFPIVGIGASDGGLEALEVLRTLVFSEKQIAAINGLWFWMRIMPYRTMEDVIGGVVINFADITAAKIQETELREENARLKRLLESGG